jgi:hypothetical protein
LKTFFAPDPLNLLVVHLPTFDAQQFGYLAIAVALVLLGQPDQGQSQSIISPGRSVLQRTARQSGHPACPSL